MALASEVVTGAVAGTTYRVAFRANARYALNGRLNDGTSNSYLDLPAQLTTEWQEFSAVVSATRTGNGYFQFYFGDFAGTIWFDDVVLVSTLPEVWRRDFDNGIVLVNAEATPQTVSLGGTYRKIRGTHCPLVRPPMRTRQLRPRARVGESLLLARQPHPARHQVRGIQGV